MLQNIKSEFGPANLNVNSCIYNNVHELYLVEDHSSLTINGDKALVLDKLDLNEKYNKIINFGE